MGWYGDYNSPTDILKEAQEDSRNSTVFELLDYSFTSYGMHLWLLILNKATGKKYVTLNLIKKFGSSFSYKPMDIDCGPFYYDCPRRIVRAMDPPETESGREWLKKWGSL